MAETWDLCMENTVRKLAYGTIAGGLAALILFRARRMPTRALCLWHFFLEKRSVSHTPCRGGGAPHMTLARRSSQARRGRGRRSPGWARAWAWAWATRTASMSSTPSQRRGRRNRGRGALDRAHLYCGCAGARTDTVPSRAIGRDGRREVWRVIVRAVGSCRHSRCGRPHERPRAV